MSKIPLLVSLGHHGGRRKVASLRPPFSTPLRSLGEPDPDTPFLVPIEHAPPLFVRIWEDKISLKIPPPPLEPATSSSPQFVLVARCPEKRNTERQQRNSSRIRSQERRERSPPLLPSEEPEPQPRRDSRLVGRLMGHGPPRRRRHAGPSHVDNMELR